MKNKNEYINADVCECPYCGAIFNGAEACNYDLDCHSVDCQECGKEIEVIIVATYICKKIKE